MLVYKTRCVPAAVLTGVTKKEFENGLSVGTANAAGAEIDEVVQEEARQGWTLHSINSIDKIMVRKKTILELIFGWIPFIGGLLFPGADISKRTRVMTMFVMAAVKEG